MILYTARWVLPVTTRPIRDGAVAVLDGKIMACGLRDEVRAAAGAGVVERDLGEVAVIPGLVNAHTHLELSWMGADPPPGGSFTRWVGGFLERRATETRETARREAAAALESLARRGTVAIGDVGNGKWILPLLVRSRLMGVSFHEIYDFRSGEAERVAREAIRYVEQLAAKAASPDWKIAAAPHAPHTSSAQLIRALATRAASLGQPISIHVAESDEEVALLRDGSGPFRDILVERGMWDDGWQPPHMTPIEHIDRLGCLGRRTLAVHCVHLGQQDHSRLQARGATVVSCPRSNAWIGVGRAPLPKLLAEGIPVALGTDSLASCPDLDLFAEMAAVRTEHPSLAPATVLRMATLNGAAALGLGERLGSIEPGKLARLVVVPLEGPADDPLERICSVPLEVHGLDDAPCEERGHPE